MVYASERRAAREIGARQHASNSTLSSFCDGSMLTPTNRMLPGSEKMAAAQVRHIQFLPIFACVRERAREIKRQWLACTRQNYHGHASNMHCHKRSRFVRSLIWDCWSRICAHTFLLSHGPV